MRSSTSIFGAPPRPPQPVTDTLSSAPATGFDVLPPLDAVRPRNAVRLIVIVLSALVLISILLEVGTRYAFSHSRIERRIADEYRAAIGIRRVAGEPSMLLVGNSLLLDDVDVGLLRELLPQTVRTYQFAIVSTRLLDWKYGLRRLFQEGARPDYVVVTVGVTVMHGTDILGEYSPYYLFRTRDIKEIADTLGYDNTKASSLY